MSNIRKDYTKKEAQDHLTNDFIKTVKRTQYLYLNTSIEKEIGQGYFEPLLLFFCWCDYLGALYTGEAGDGTSTKRSKAFICDILGNTNEHYKRVVDKLMDLYRHRLVHTYHPKNFHISIKDLDTHLTIKDGNLHISITKSLDEMLLGINLFASKFDDDENNSNERLMKFNKARQEIDK